MVPPTHERMMWRVTEAPWTNVAKVVVLFLCGVQLVLRSGVFTVLDLDEVDVTPRFADVFGRVGAVWGWWLYWWMAVLLGCSQSPSIAPATPKNLPPYICLLFLCVCSDGSNQHKIWAAGGKSVFIWEAVWEEPFGNDSTFSCFRNVEVLHGHPFVAAYIFGDNA